MITFTVGTLFVRVVFQHAARGIECVAQCDVDVLMLISIDLDLAARHAQTNVDIKQSSLMLMSLYSLNRHVTTDNSFIARFYFPRFVAYSLVERRRMLHVAHCDLQWCLHNLPTS